MPTNPSPFMRMMNSLSFRLQSLTIFLSLVGVAFGVRSYLHVREVFGEEKSAFIYNDLIIQLGIAVVLNILAAFIIYGIATKPIRSLGEIMRALTEGKIDVAVPYLKQGTEIGSMARKVEIFKQNAIDKQKLEEEQRLTAIRTEKERKAMMEKLASDFEAAILSVVEIVTTSASDMQSNAKNLTEMAEETSRQSATVSTATDQASASVQTVAAASEELSASISEINNQVMESSRISNEAVNEVKRADQTISTLSEAATQIGDVVQLIQDIASQTNLLALNATIEAARAGEAGKGFAVVASEVKNLASQTGKATEEISKKIATVQSVSTDSVAAIRSIGKTIEKTNEIAGVISNAIQQQTEATKEISRNVQQAYAGTSEVSSSITNVTKAATESRSAANEVFEDSNKLSQQAERLQKEIHTFLEKVRHE